MLAAELASALMSLVKSGKTTKQGSGKSQRKIRSGPLPYFFADGSRENGTLCCGLPSGTYTNLGYVVLPLLQMGGLKATSTR